MGTVMPLGFMVFDKILKDHRQSPAGVFNATMLFGDISYAGVDTNVKPLNVTKADEWQYVWDLFGRQVEPLAATVCMHTGKCRSTQSLACSFPRDFSLCTRCDVA